MVDENPTSEHPTVGSTQPAEPVVKAPPIESRFLFVDVAALRAKQLRRGARPRLAGLAEAQAEGGPDVPRKPERVAMEEVKQNLVLYELREVVKVVDPEENR